jgi:hypothetical protein
MPLTADGKNRVVEAMYQKGKAFLGSSILLKSHSNCEAHEYVVRHLLCQGIETVLKAVLLLTDYDKYEPKLRQFGHNLRELADEVIMAAAQKPMTPNIAKELDELSTFYSNHRLRYGGIHDIFHDPNNIRYELVLKRVYAGLRLIQRHGAKRAPSPLGASAYPLAIRRITLL